MGHTVQDFPHSNASRGLAILLEQIARAAYEERGPNVVQPAQWQTLRYFGRASAKARTVTGLANFLQITKGPASRSVDALARRGLLASIKNPEDGRSHIYSLTEEGLTTLDHDPINRLAQAIDALESPLQSELQRALFDLADAMKPADDKGSG